MKGIEHYWLPGQSKCRCGCSERIFFDLKWFCLKKFNVMLGSIQYENLQKKKMMK